MCTCTCTCTLVYMYYSGQFLWSFLVKLYVYACNSMSDMRYYAFFGQFLMISVESVFETYMYMCIYMEQYNTNDSFLLLNFVFIVKQSHVGLGTLTHFPRYNTVLVYTGCRKHFWSGQVKLEKYVWIVQQSFKMNKFLEDCDSRLASEWWN